MKLFFLSTSRLIELSVAIFAILLIASCTKPDVDIINNNNNGTHGLTAFSVQVVQRNLNNAIINWIPVIDTANHAQVKYKVYLSGLLIHQGLTVTTDTLNNLSADIQYNGKVTAYTINGDSASATFSLVSLSLPAPESIQGIIVLTLNTNNIYVLNFYNPDRSLRWHREFRNYNNYNTNPYGYYQNKLYYDDSDTLTVMDIQTGNVIFTIPHLGELYSSMVFRNDTMYHGTLLWPGNELIARNCNTGQEYWRKNLNAYNFLTELFEIDNGLIAARSFPTSTTMSMHAIDLSTRSDKWSNTLRYYWPTARVTIANNTFYTTSEFGSIMALDEMTGSLKWTDINEHCHHPILAGSTLYAISSFNDIPTFQARLHAFDPLTGAEQWAKDCVGTNYIYGPPAIIGNRIYTAGADAVTLKYHLEILDASNGNQLFKKSSMPHFLCQFFAGNEYYAATTDVNSEIKIFAMNPNTAEKVDSLVFSNVFPMFISPAVLTSAGKLKFAK